MATLEFCGGVGTATGANFLLTITTNKTHRILLDCGFLQGVPGANAFNAKKFSYIPEDIDILLVSHAHADHIGRIPRLVKAGFKGVIYSTPATRDLAAIMLRDSAQIIMRETPQGEEGLYTAEDVEHALSLWKNMHYYEEKELLPQVFVQYKDAGHILGSSIIEISTEQEQTSLDNTKVQVRKKIAYTGDLGNTPSLFLRDTDYVTDANYLIIETVYGDRNHESKEARRYKFEQILRSIIERKRTLIIPAFSLERTQDLLFEINRLVEDKLLPAVPVFIDSPLATKATEVYRRFTSDFKDAARKQVLSGDDVFDFSKLRFTPRMDESAVIPHTPNPKIIIAGSGMSAGGRIVNHEIRYLPDPETTILFVGYQALGTVGRQIVEGARSVTLEDTVVDVKAEVQTIFGYSSHKDSDALLDFVLKAGEGGTLKKVFTVLGEPKSAMFLAQRINSFGIGAVYPQLGQTVELDL